MEGTKEMLEIKISVGEDHGILKFLYWKPFDHEYKKWLYICCLEVMISSMIC